MKRTLSIAGAFGLGLGVMYFFDPVYGRRRRALTRDQFHSTARRATCIARKTREDLQNRTRGVIASLRSNHRADASDPVVEARIHAKLGRVISHPRALQVHVNGGCATLRGPVLSQEVPALLAAVAAIPGVCEVNNQLDLHEEAGNIPALQGHGAPARTRFFLAKDNWPPAARLVSLVAGGALGFYGLVHGKLVGKLLALSGGALCLRALTNLGAARLTGIGAGCRAVDLRKTITIQAPIEDVFNFWARFENLSRFLSHVKEVHVLDSGRSHWTVRGPAGRTIEWTAAITGFSPYELLAWETEPGSVVEHAGLVRFFPTPSGGTRLEIFMSYNPPAGAIGHMIAVLLGSDPKRAMDDDLVRFKSLMEQGKARIDRHTVTRGDLAMPAAISDETR